MFISQPPCGDACSLLEPDSSSTLQPASAKHSTQQGNTPCSSPNNTLQPKSSIAAATRQPDMCTTNTEVNASCDYAGSFDSTPESVAEQVVQQQTASPSALGSCPKCATAQQRKVDTTPHVGAQDTAGMAQQPASYQKDSMLLADNPMFHTLDKQHHAGSLQRKPGRGDTTLSMSCSDKIARWALLGMQVSCTDSCMQLMHVVSHAFAAIYLAEASAILYADANVCRPCSVDIMSPNLITRIDTLRHYAYDSFLHAHKRA